MSEPESLLDREDVRSQKGTRAFEKATFEALRERYETIDGVIQIGVVNDDEEVLLWGDDGTEWTVPGGDVEPGEDWEAAARRAIEELTDATIEINEPRLIEETIFQRQDDTDDQFSAYSVHFSASPAEGESKLITNPSVAEDLDHKYIDDESTVDFEWFDRVPDDADPNHEDDIRLFVD